MQFFSHPKRLQALQSIALPTTPHEPVFERLTALACRLLHAPIALISLVDSNQQFFGSGQGLAEPWAACWQPALSDPLCRQIVGANAPLIVEDACADATRCNNLAVGERNVVACLGVPLHAHNGEVIGSFCVIEDKPRQWTEDDLQTLSDLAHLVMRELATHHYLQQQQAIAETLRKDNGLLQGIVNSIGDISEQRRSTEKLAYHAHLLDNMHDAVIATDAQFNISVWNRGAEQLYGWAASETLGRPVRQVIGSEMSDEKRQIALQELRTSGRYRSELITRHKDGTPISTEGITVALNDGTDTIIGYLSINRDISERKQAESALLESQERFRIIFEQAAVGMAQCDLAGNYVRVNNCLCEILGYRREELLQKESQTITHPDDVANNQIQLQRLLDGECDSYFLEKRYLRKDGSYVWVGVTVSLVRKLKTHEPDYFIRIIEDISKRKQYEQALQELNATLEQKVSMRSKQLQTSNSKLLESESKLRQLSQQLMQMTEQERKRISREIHDQLGQSLTAIKMEVKGAQRRVAPDAVAVTSRLEAASKLIDETVDTVRRIAADLRPDVLDHFGLGPAVEWLMGQFKKHNPIDYQLDINVDPERITPDMATAAFRILQEALTNIVRHAQASKVCVTLTTEEEFRMTVQDNGKGLQENSSQRQSLGILGMSERAQQLGGSVTLSNVTLSSVTLSGEQGSGAMVTLTLPIQGK